MVAAHRPGELPKSKLTQPRSETFWVTLYYMNSKFCYHNSLDHELSHLTRGVLCVGDERGAAEGVDPVVVPQGVQQPLVHRRLKVRHVEAGTFAG